MFGQEGEIYAFSPYAIPTALTAVLMLVSGIRVLSRRVSRVSFAFFSITFFCSIWLVAFTFMYCATRPGAAQFWSRVAYLGVPFIPAAVYHFTLEMLRIVDKRRVPLTLSWTAALSFSAIAVELFRGDNLNAMLVSKIEVAFRIHLSAQPDLQRVALFDQAFLDGVFHRCAVRMRAAKVSSPGVAMRIELHKCDLPEMLVNRAQDGQQNGMVSANTHGSRPGLEDLPKLVDDSLVSVFYGERVNGQIAIICDSGLFERIDIQRRIPGPDDCRLLPHTARSESRTRTIGGSAVVGYADQGDIEFVGA